MGSKGDKKFKAKRMVRERKDKEGFEGFAGRTRM